MNQANQDPAQAWVVSRLSDALEDPFTAGVLVLTCKPSPGMTDAHRGAPADTRQVSAVMMNGLSQRTAMDTVMLIRGLREIADRLEATMGGKTPIPDQSQWHGLLDQRNRRK